MKALRLLPALLASCLFAIIAVPPVQADAPPSTIDWTGASDPSTPDATAPGNWSTPPLGSFPFNNFQFGEVASAQNAIVIPTIYSEVEPYEPVPVAVYDLYFRSTANPTYSFSFSGQGADDSGILLLGNVDIAAGGTVTLGNDLAFLLSNTNHTVTIGEGSTLFVNAPVFEYDEDDGSASISKSGTGTLVLNSEHSDFTGGVTINEGTLLIGASSHEGMASMVESEDSGPGGPLGLGTLKMEAGTTLGLSDTGSYELHNWIDLGCNSGLVKIAIDGCGELALLGQISGAGGILKKGDGTLVLVNGDNDFEGGVTVKRGTLVIGSSSYTEDIIEGETVVGQRIVSGPVGIDTLKFETDCTMPELVLADNGCYILHNNIDLGCFTGSVKIDTGCGDLTLAGTITGKAGITKAGDGELTLEGENDFEGDFQVNGGTVNVEDNDALGGGVLRFGESSNAEVYFNTRCPVIYGLAGPDCTASIYLDCNTELTIDQCVNTSFAGVIYGEDGSLIKTGSGALGLTGANTFGGGLTVKNGSILLGRSSNASEDDIGDGVYARVIHDGPVGTGTLKFEADGTTPGLGLADSGSYTLHNDIDLGCFTGSVKIDTGCGDLTLLGTISGSASLVKVGTGTLTMGNYSDGDGDTYGGSNTFANGITVKNGTLRIAYSSEAGDGMILSGPVGTGTLKFETDGTSPVFAIAGNDEYELHNNIDLGCFTGTVTFDTGCGDLTLLGTISGTAGMNKAGEGTLTLLGNNTMAGDFYVSAGTVEVNHDHGLGSGALEFGEAEENATVNFNTSTPVIGGLEGDNANDVINLAGVANAGAHLTIHQTETSAYAGKIAGPGSVTKDGEGSLTLSGASTFSGGFTIAEGKVVLGSSTTMDGSSILSGPLGLGALKISDAATLSAVGMDRHFANAIDLSTNTAAVNFAAEASSSLWLDGVLTGSHDITKTGLGTVFINHDNSATFTGGTTVQQGTLVANVTGALGTGGAITLSGGTLVANAAGSLGGGTINFNGGALKIGSGVTLTNTLNLASGGTLAGNYTFNTPQTFGTGVTLSPGNSPGTIAFNAGYAPTTGLTLQFEFNAATDDPGVSSDLITVSGGALDLSAGGYTLKAISLDIANNPGAVSGLSTTLPTSWTIITSADLLTTFNPASFTINQDNFVNAGSFGLSQSGNNIVLTFTPVPEPSTYALMALGTALTGFAAWRKRRRA